MKELPDKINVIMALRVHMESLWSLHDYLINQHEGIADTARSRVAETIATFKKATGKDEVVGLHALAQLADGKIEEQVPILLDWDDAKTHRQVGWNLKNLRRRYATGKIQKN